MILCKQKSYVHTIGREVGRQSGCLPMWLFAQFLIIIPEIEDENFLRDVHIFISHFRWSFSTDDSGFIGERTFFPSPGFDRIPTPLAIGLRLWLVTRIIK